MKEYRVVNAEWIECAEGYGYWEYEFEEIDENGNGLGNS